MLLDFQKRPYNYTSGKNRKVKFKCPDCESFWKDIKSAYIKTQNVSFSSMGSEDEATLREIFSHQWEFYKLFAPMVHHEKPYTPRYQLFDQYRDISSEWLGRLIAGDIALKDLSLPFLRPEVSTKKLAPLNYWEGGYKENLASQIHLHQLEDFFIPP
jgi:hypothetical protein